MPEARHEKHRVRTALRKEPRDEGGNKSVARLELASGLKVAGEISRHSALSFAVAVIQNRNCIYGFVVAASVSPYNLRRRGASFI
jgi:hypothetical protein